MRCRRRTAAVGWALCMAGLLLPCMRSSAAAAAAPGRSSGSQQTQLVEGGGTLFSWGLREWRLGRNTGDSSIPEPALQELKVISIAGSRHSAIATSEGHVWTMGHNDSKGGGGHGSPPLEASGQLGRTDGGRQPGRVLGALKDEFVVQVVTGRYHTLAVTASGAVFTWGLNDWGQLGRPGVGASNEDDPSECVSGPSCHDGRPQQVAQLQGTRIVGAAAGRYNTMALDDRGRLHVWGMDGCASGGVLPARGEAWRARLVEGQLAGRRIVAFDEGYTLWIAAAEDGAVFTCNHQDDGYGGTLAKKRQGNDAGELGRGGSAWVPLQVKGQLEGKKVVAVAAGREHALAATEEGRVYSWGGGRDVIGRPDGSSSEEPGLVEGELAKDVIQFVAAGEYFSLAASERHVYGWGGNNYHTVGVGRNRPRVPTPERVLGPLAGGGWKVLGLAAGFQHSMAIAVRTSEQQEQ